jgi:hypothetical protein
MGRAFRSLWSAGFATFSRLGPAQRAVERRAGRVCYRAWLPDPAAVIRGSGPLGQPRWPDRRHHPVGLRRAVGSHLQPTCRVRTSPRGKKSTQHAIHERHVRRRRCGFVGSKYQLAARWMAYSMHIRWHIGVARVCSSFLGETGCLRTHQELKRRQWPEA